MTEPTKPRHTTRERKPDSERSRAYRQRGAAVVNTPIGVEAAQALEAAVAAGMTKRAAVEAALILTRHQLSEQIAAALHIPRN
ncbi:MAG: hypothetical protein ACRDAM_21955 [Casimicrobium sp.]